MPALIGLGLYLLERTIYYTRIHSQKLSHLDHALAEYDVK